MLGQYSNGWGHVIVTVCVITMATLLMIFRVVDAVAGIGIVSPVIAFWFLTGTVNRFNPTANKGGTNGNPNG